MNVNRNAVSGALFRALVQICMLSTPAYAADAVHTGLFNNMAISGFDAVAYCTEGRPAGGIDQYALECQGTTLQLSSEQHREIRRAMPEKFAPQYSGYCAWAIANSDITSAKAGTLEDFQ